MKERDKSGLMSPHESKIGKARDITRLCSHGGSKKEFQPEEFQSSDVSELRIGKNIGFGD